jgi:hypothetical protein
MKNKKRFSHLLCSVGFVRFARIALGACLCTSVRADVETLVIDPAISWAVNGTGQVQSIFGGVVNGSSRDEGIDYIRELNLNSSRAFLWGPGRPGHGFKSPWYAAQYGGKPVTREEAFAKWDAFYEAGEFPRQMQEWWDQGYPRNSQIYQTELYKKWGFDGDVVLHNELDGSADRHPDAVNVYYQAYLDTVTAKAPWMKVRFLQFQNEPNYSHWTGQFASDKEASATLIRCFNRLDTFLRAEHRETTLLGPCLASSAFFSWTGWRDWTLPVLREFKHVDYFNYQVYGKGAGENMAWLSMLQAAGEALRDVRPRGVITETNLTPGAIVGSQTFRWESENLFMALEHPDKIALRTFFLLAYPNLKTRQPERGTNILNMQDGELKPSVVYWIYWVLAGTRGDMLWVTRPANPDVRVIASKPAANRITLSLRNSGEDPVTLMLSPGQAGQVKEVLSRWTYMEDETIFHGEQPLVSEADGAVSVTLRPGEVRSVAWRFADALPAPVANLDEREYFSTRTALGIRENTGVTVNVPGPPAENEVAFLRLGVKTDDVLMARELDYSLNGKPGRVIWASQPQFVLSRFGGFPNTWWVEVPLAPGQAADAVNRLTFPEPDANYRLLFASIVYKPFPDARAADAWREARAAGSAGESIRAGLRLEGSLYGGEDTPLELTLANDTPRPVNYDVAWKLPPSISTPGTRSGETAPASVRLESGEHKTLDLSLGVSGRLAEIDEGVVRLMVEDADSHVKRTLSRNVRVYPALRAAGMPIPADAGLTDEFVRTVPVSREWSEGTLSATTRMAWDSRALLVAVTVNGAGEPQAAATLNDFWRADSIEVFMDLDNDKAQSFNRDDFQLFFCPVGPGGDPKPVAGIVGRQVRDDSVANTGPRLEPRFTVRRLPAPGGYTIVCVIPWKVLKPDFSPSAGGLVGCNLSLTARHASGTFDARSIVGAKGKFYDRPDGWSVLRLMPQ